MRAVLDTNVVISAVLNPRGASRAILSAWEQSEFTWVASGELLEELARALAYPDVARRINWPPQQLADFLDSVRLGVTVVESVDLPDGGVVSADRDDDILFAAALAGAAEFVVTGDRQVLAARVYRDIDVITPRDFLSRLRARP